MSLLDHTAKLAQEYLDELSERQVAAPADFETTLSALDKPLPESSADPDGVIQELADVVGAATVASAGPRYFGFVVGGALPAALAADWLAAAWDQMSFNQVSAPGVAAVEVVCERWVLDVLGLPDSACVGFATGATGGNFVGVSAARHRLLADEGWDVEARGLFGAPELRVLVGEEVHTSLLFALRIAGLGAERVDHVESDGQGAMRADKLAETLAAGAGPAIVCAQVGNVSTGASDPVGEIVTASREYGPAWVHVDGAFGLWAAASPELRHLVAGVETADSWAVDAHKWLNVPYDSGLAIVADPAAVHGAFGTSAAYLPGSAGREPGELVPEMSRRARAIPIFAALRTLGREGLADLVERCCAHTRRLADAMEKLDGAEVLNNVVLNQVLVRFGDDDQTTEAVMKAVRDEGDAWLAGTVWRGLGAARVAFSNHSTTDADVDRLAAAFKRALAVS